MTQTLKLYYKESLIGQLSFVNEDFIFNVDENFNDFFILKTLNFENEKEFRSKNLFFIFLRFIPEKTRTDIIKEAKIKKDDDIFTVLNKVADLNLDKDQFWIGK